MMKLIMFHLMHSKNLNVRPKLLHVLDTNPSAPFYIQNLLVNDGVGFPIVTYKDNEYL
jgi:hypothetical protein